MGGDTLIIETTGDDEEMTMKRLFILKPAQNILPCRRRRERSDDN